MARCAALLLSIWIAVNPSVAANRKLPIERLTGVVDQTLDQRGLVVKDVKARDILKVC